MVNLKNSSYTTLIVVTLLALGSGFIIGNLSPSIFTNKQEVKDEDLEGKSLYTTQTATIQGKITKINGKELSVLNKDGLTGDVEVLDNVAIIKPNQGVTSGPVSTASADLKTLETNKDVLITLMIVDGEYKASAINYLPAPPSLPKLPLAPRQATPSSR